MKLHTDSTADLNTITGYGDNYLEINHERYEHAVYFQPKGDVHAWNVTQLSDITPEVLKTVLNPKPEIVLIGTGSQQHFLPSKLIHIIYSEGVGVEMMTTQAAARTYNILMAESRQVLALLLPPSIS